MDAAQIVQIPQVTTVLSDRGEVDVLSINGDCVDAMFLKDLCLNVCLVLLQQCGNGRRGEPCDTDTPPLSPLEENVKFW